MAILNLTKTTTVEALRKEFNDAFGAQVKLYNGNKKAEPGDTLGALGLAEDGTFECRSSLTVASFIDRMAERGVKVKVYTCDEWVAVLDGLTLESAGKVKKNAVKADMESMIAYLHTNTVESAATTIENEDVENFIDDDDNDDDEWLDSDGDTVVDNIMYDLYGDGTAMARLFEEDEEREQITIPATINYNGKTYTVTSFAISDGEYSELNLPSTIKTIDGEAFSEMDRETRDKLVVNLAADAQVLYKGKAFYSKDKKHLTNTSLMPDCKEYTVTDGVEQIWNYAFAAHNEIETLNVPASVKQIDSPFSDESGLKIVNIFNHEGNVKFYDEEPGVESFPKGTTINYHPRKESQELKQNTQPKGQLSHTTPSNNPTKKGFKDRWHDLPIKYKIISILSILLPFVFGFWAIIITIAVLWYIWKRV